jgi:hypothetical protein
VPLAGMCTNTMSILSKFYFYDRFFRLKSEIQTSTNFDTRYTHNVIKYFVLCH